MDNNTNNNKADQEYFKSEKYITFQKIEDVKEYYEWVKTYEPERLENLDKRFNKLNLE